MDRNRLRAYMALIRELLRCPDGKELALLQANLVLVDTNLIALMERVATRAKQKDAFETADFLLDLAQQLKEMLAPVEGQYDKEDELYSIYIQVIEELLNCSSGAETEILRLHQDIIDTRFILTLQQLAAMFADIGEKKAAEFLQTIAVPLTQALGNPNSLLNSGSSSDLSSNFVPSEYIDFLGDVLRLTAKSNGDAQAVYTLLEANLDKLNIHFAQILDNWATSTLVAVKPEIALSIADDILSFSHLIQDFPAGEPAYNIEIAISGYEAALRAYRRDQFPKKWASVQKYLGQTYIKRILGEKATNIEVAIESYRVALEIFEREHFPKQWAETLRHIATAYEKRIYGNQQENLQTATEYFRIASQVFPEENE
jgi:tetratricopeptide (TPR) repeat protein